MELTVNALKEMGPEKVFATGETTNDPEGVFITREHLGRKLLWIAKRGDVYDWTIYIGWAEYQIGDHPLTPIGYHRILSNGDKVMKEDAKKLVPCTDEAFNLYRR